MSAPALADIQRQDRLTRDMMRFIYPVKFCTPQTSTHTPTMARNSLRNRNVTAKPTPVAPVPTEVAPDAKTSAPVKSVAHAAARVAPVPVAVAPAPVATTTTPAAAGVTPIVPPLAAV